MVANIMADDSWSSLLIVWPWPMITKPTVFVYFLGQVIIDRVDLEVASWQYLIRQILELIFHTWHSLECKHLCNKHSICNSATRLVLMLTYKCHWRYHCTAHNLQMSRNMVIQHIYHKSSKPTQYLDVQLGLLLGYNRVRISYGGSWTNPYRMTMVSSLG